MILFLCVLLAIGIMNIVALAVLLRRHTLAPDYTPVVSAVTQTHNATNELLDRRFTTAFELVGSRLEVLHKGLGELQALSSSVGDLRKVLGNVKTRGIWGEIQLGRLLEQVLHPGQYEQNVATKPGSNDRVEFALKIPVKDAPNGFVWLPIDAKFP